MQTANPQVLMQQIDEHNEKYFEAVKTSVNNLVDLKVGLVKHDIILDDKIDHFKMQLGQIDGNNQSL